MGLTPSGLLEADDPNGLHSNLVAHGYHFRNAKL
jgi:hypothetical protein